MTEFELIDRLRPLLPTNDFVVAGAGDDCAVLELGDPGHHTLFKTDAVVEGVHFTRGTDPERVGHKALARCLSDIAAMGGTATAAVVTLGLPDGFDPAWVEAAYRGMGRLAARHQVAIVGGETTRNPDRVLLSVALIGRVPAGRAVRRSGALPGDALFVTGELGGSIEGHHLDFEPRLAEGRWLAEQAGVHAMMDVSDGLAGDLRHLLRSSGGLGAELFRPAIPIRRAARARARSGPGAKPAILAALTDGEDFELLVAVAPGAAVGLLDGWKQAFPGVPLACIGKVLPTPEFRLRDPLDGMRPLPAAGYTHFGPDPADPAP